jgi:hypothetical protein
MTSDKTEITTRSIPEDRPLSEKEKSLLRWLLEHGTREASTYIIQIPHLRVSSRCPCGCASIDFAVGGKLAASSGGMQILADYLWDEADNGPFGVFVFARGEQLAGLEVWSAGSADAPKSLPDPQQLRPFGPAQN